MCIRDRPTGNLDSKMGAEVMELLHQLNKEDGRTIVTVSSTHLWETPGTRRARCVPQWRGWLLPGRDVGSWHRIGSVSYTHLPVSTAATSAQKEDMRTMKSGRKWWTTRCV